MKTNSSYADISFRAAGFILGLLLVVLFISMFALFSYKSLPIIKNSGLLFFVSGNWNPANLEFGALHAILGTIFSALIAILFVFPISLLTAWYLVDSCPKPLRSTLLTIISLLGSIPSIVYGMLGLFFLVPFLDTYFFSGGMGVFSAGIVLALMSLPFLVSLLFDIFSLVPSLLKESAFGIGATKTEVLLKIVLPFCKKSIIGAVFLVLGRSLGETMAVTFVIGNFQKNMFNIFQPGTSITATLANEFAEATEPLHQSALIFLAVTLLIISLVTQIIINLFFSEKTKGIAT